MTAVEEYRAALQYVITECQCIGPVDKLRVVARCEQALKAPAAPRTHAADSLAAGAQK